MAFNWRKSLQPLNAKANGNLLKAARVFDGVEVHVGWIVVVRGERIDGAGPEDKVAILAGAASDRLDKEKEIGMQSFLDPTSPRCQLSFENLPRGPVTFPPRIVEAVAKERAKFAPEIFTEEYARKSLERHTLAWHFEGLRMAYRERPDGIEVLGVSWEETDKYRTASAVSEVKVVQP